MITKVRAQEAIEAVRAQANGRLPGLTQHELNLSLQDIHAFIEGVVVVEGSADGFCMVYAAGGHAPQRRHADRDAARVEAGRIARKHGVTTFVLEAVEEIKPTTTIAVTRLRVEPTNVTPFGPSVG